MVVPPCAHGPGPNDPGHPTDERPGPRSTGQRRKPDGVDGGPMFACPAAGGGAFSGVVTPPRHASSMCQICDGATIDQVRLGLARIIDTHGWAVQGVTGETDAES